MPRALLLLPLLAVITLATAAEVFVIADTANQTRTIADNAKETIAEANDIVLAGHDTVSDSDNHEPVVRKKRTFGDVVFRGLADVLGYNVARKPPQVAFPPPLAPVPGIDTPLQVSLVPAVSAGPAPPPPAPATPPCGAPRAAAPPPCRAQAPPPPPPKPTQPPCPRPRANPRPRPRPRPKPRPSPPPPPPPPPSPPPCANPRANPTTPSPCAPQPPPPAAPKADSNLETITSNFRLNFNFNRAPATPAPQAESEQELEQDQEQIEPVAIRPQAAQLPQDPPRSPRVYLDAFVVQNGVAQKVHAVDARNLNPNAADDDYLVYDEEEQPQQDHDYEYVEPRGRAQAIRDFGDAVDQFWEQKKNKKPKKKKLPANDYRNVHFGDRELADQYRQQQKYKEARPQSNLIATSLPEAEEEDAEITTTTQDPRRRLKPRVLPPTEHNPNQIDTVTVRVPPIYKEKRPKKLHRKRPEEPDREEEEDIQEIEEQGYESDSDTDNSDAVPQTEKPKRKRRRKSKRITRSAYESHEPHTAGDYDYYGNKLPISDEEVHFRGLTVPPPTKDADIVRHEEGKSGGGYFLDDHERLQEDSERIKSDDQNNEKERITEKEWADESERSDEKERSNDNERSGENERADETERTDKLSPNARVRESGYQNNYVHSTNVQVDDPRPLVATVKKKKTKIGKA